MTIVDSMARLPRHCARAVLADPPWSFATWSDRGMDRSAEQHYGCMTLAEIKRLPVRGICDIDCWLFLWATGPLLPQAIETMTAWGFTYSAIGFAWAKRSRTSHSDDYRAGWHVGMGHTTRHNVELCLLGKRGKPTRNSASVRELIVSPVREHSRKPDEVRNRIEQFCDGPYIELFARSRRPGWRCLGDEAAKFQAVA